MKNSKKIITEIYDKHFPEKCVKFNSYKYKLTKWITLGIFKSIEFRDKLYERLKTCAPGNGEYGRWKHNSKTYNRYLNQCIRTAKKEEFSKYKNDIRNTWDALKEIIHKKTFKSDFPSCFVHDGVDVKCAKTIADKFNEYFTEIGPKLARSIDTINKRSFNSYLNALHVALFKFNFA